jgi:M6 family metalloprotease-like protein
MPTASSFYFCYDDDKMKRLITLTLLIGFQLLQSSSFSITSTLSGVTYRDVRINEGYATAMPSAGLVNMLVIPIQFSDATCAEILEGCQQTKDNIDTAFFGSPSELPWHSVASYYHTSSYGQLTIEGMVTDWFTPTITAVELSNNRGLLGGDIIQPALTYFKETYPNRVLDFDQDQDGYLDAVYFIYSLTFDPQGEQYGEDKDVFWAFVAYQGGAANVLSPTLFHYGWSSYQFMYEDGYYQRSANGKAEWNDDNEPIFFPWKDNQGRRTVDAHVYIHEVGHLLGLLDYYSYDRSAGDWGPSGALDMMDYNIGDHNGFSKMALGWIPPTFIRQPGTVVLPSMATQPSMLMLTKPNPTTMMDEYLLLEFYQPIGLNQKDSQASFSGRYPRMFTSSGLKIYHIDARIAQLMVTSQGLTFDAYVKDMVYTSGYRYQLAHSNTVSRNAVGTNPNFKLIHLLESSGVNTFKHQGFATNATLFQTGMSFNDQNQPFYFNDGTRLPWQLTIGEITPLGIELALTKIPT